MGNDRDESRHDGRTQQPAARAAPHHPEPPPPWDPWEPPPDSVYIHSTLTRTVPRTGPAEYRRKATEETLNRLPEAKITIFTDGSASAGTENGGAGAVVYEEDR